MRPLSACLFCCVAFATSAELATAQVPEGTVVTLAPGGDAPETEREAALRTLEQSIVSSDLNPVFVAALASVVGDKGLATCSESDCALRAATQTNALAIAGVSVWQKGRSRKQTTITITWRDLMTPNAEEQFTDIPLIGSLSIDEAVASGVAKFIAQDDDTVLVSIDSDPQGAAATIDGKPLGKTPLEVKLKPGGHELTLMLDDRYQPSRQAIMVAVTSTRFEVPLERKVELVTPTESVDEPGEASSSLNTIVGAALLVAGAGMMAYGVYALSVDGDTRLTSEDGEQEWKVRNTAGLGVGFVIAGGLSAAAGGLLSFSQPF